MDIADGSLQPYPIFGTSTGWHSTNKDSRKSDIEELGEGTCLYFKFLKYFMVIFFVAALISLPATFINLNGNEYDYVTDEYHKLLGYTTLGNLGSYVNQTCSSAYVPATINSASYIGLSCDEGKNLTNLDHFGLAF